MNSKTNILVRINFLFVLLFILVLPFHNRYITYLFIPWTIVSIVLAFQKRIQIKEIINHSIFFFIYYTISVLSLFYSNDFIYGIKYLEIQVSLIIMPFLLLIFKVSDVKDGKKYIIKIFILGLFLYIVSSIIVLLIRMDFESIMKSLETDSLITFARNYQLSYLQHTSYISMYLIWGIILIANRSFRGKGAGFIVLELFMAIVFLIFIVLLGSRASLLTLLIVTIYYVWKLLRGVPYWLSVTITSAVLILFIVGVIKYSRIGDTVIIETENSKIDNRISLYSDAYQVFIEAPIFGHGIGDALNKMVDKHNKNGITVAGTLRLNAHNQFLETATQTGIIGLLSLILILLVPLINSIKKKQELLFLLITIVFVNLLFESMLSRLAGVLFLGFWLNFLIILQNDNESERSKKQFRNLE